MSASLFSFSVCMCVSMYQNLCSGGFLFYRHYIYIALILCHWQILSHACTQHGTSPKDCLKNGLTNCGHLQVAFFECKRSIVSFQNKARL